MLCLPHYQTRQTAGEKARTKPLCLVRQLLQPIHWIGILSLQKTYTSCVRLFPEGGNLSAPLLFGSQKKKVKDTQRALVHM